MAGEQILIVDDTPVNLKLTRILLVNEGYQVLTAESAEEALELLGSYHPSLVLADVQLPGMDGLELARRIKQNPATGDILVVALTAYAMKGDEQRAMEAGCDGYITKPIDTRTLGLRLREYLDRGSRPPTPASSPLRAEVPATLMGAEADLHDLRRIFLAEGLERCQRLLIELDEPFNARDAVKPVHQWAGTASLLGYHAIGRLAREAEAVLHDRPLDQAQLREVLTNLVAAFLNPRLERDAAISDYVLERLSGRRVALVGLPAGEQERLAATLERANVATEIYEGELDAVPQTLLECEIAVVRVPPNTSVASWLAADSGLWTTCSVVLTGSRDDLLANFQTVPSGVRELLMDSWQPEEALLRLSLALSRPPLTAFTAPAGLRVLVADSDPTVLALACTSLQAFGMDCQTAADGPAALQAIRTLRPHAAVLEASMPGLDGYGVLAAARSEEIPVRILLLVARQEESDIMRGFSLGADDYVIKPFSPMELVLRLKRLLGR